MLATIERYLPGKTSSATDATATGPINNRAENNELLAINARKFNIEKLMAVGSGANIHREKLRGFITSLIANTQKSLMTLGALHEQGDWEACARSLHTLRGTIGMLGAVDFIETAKTLEAELMAQQSVTHSRELWRKMRDELEQTLTAAQQWLDEPG